MTTLTPAWEKIRTEAAAKNETLYRFENVFGERFELLFHWSGVALCAGDETDWEPTPLFSDFLWSSGELRCLAEVLVKRADELDRVTS